MHRYVETFRRTLGRLNPALDLPTLDLAEVDLEPDLIDRDGRRSRNARNGLGDDRIAHPDMSRTRRAA